MTEEQYTKYKSWLTLMRDQALTGSSRMAYEDALSVLVGIKHNWPSVAFLPQSK